MSAPEHFTCTPECIPCDRCLHPDCEHLDADLECASTGCECVRWLSHGDCRECQGEGVISSPSPSGNTHDWIEYPCGNCGGTGIYYYEDGAA